MQSTVPADILTATILVGTLLSGSLINNVPGLNDVVNLTSLINCTSLSAPPNEIFTENMWILVMPILLPIIYIFLIDGSFTLDRNKLMALYQHCTGQIMSFSSSEIIRHFIVSPNLNFPAKCNLTEKNCQAVFNEFTNTSQLCHNSEYSNKQIFDSLHSIPNAAIALLGSSTVFLLSHLKSTGGIPPFFKKYKIFSQHLWKVICLCVFFGTTYFCLWQTISIDMSSVQDLLFSFIYGVIVQLTVQQIKKNDNVTQPSLATELQSLNKQPE